jgi:hypothetical protein
VSGGLCITCDSKSVIDPGLNGAALFNALKFSPRDGGLGCRKGVVKNRTLLLSFRAQKKGRHWTVLEFMLISIISYSLASRVREIVPSIPGLVAWQVSEGRALLQGTPSDRTLSGTKQ